MDTPVLKSLIWRPSLDPIGTLMCLSEGKWNGKLGIFLTALFDDDKPEDYIVDEISDDVIVYFNPGLLDLYPECVVRQGSWTKTNRGKRYTPTTRPDLGYLKGTNHCITIPFNYRKSPFVKVLTDPYDQNEKREFYFERRDRKIQTHKFIRSMIRKVEFNRFWSKSVSGIIVTKRTVALAYKTTQVNYYSRFSNFFFQELKTRPNIIRAIPMEVHNSKNLKLAINKFGLHPVSCILRKYL